MVEISKWVLSQHLRARMRKEPRNARNPSKLSNLRLARQVSAEIEYLHSVDTHTFHSL